MTVTMAPQLVQQSPEMMAIITAPAKEAWFDFARRSLTTFEAHKPGYGHLLEDDEVIKSIAGHNPNRAVWPGTFMGAMFSRGYEIITSRRKQYEHLARMTNLSYAAGSLLTAGEWSDASVNARVVADLFSSVPGLSFKAELPNKTSDNSLALALVEDGWAVMQTADNGRISSALYPGSDIIALSEPEKNDGVEHSVLHAVRLQM